MTFAIVIPDTVIAQAADAFLRAITVFARFCEMSSGLADMNDDPEGADVAVELTATSGTFVVLPFCPERERRT